MDLKEARQTHAEQQHRHPWELARADVCRRLLMDGVEHFGRRDTRVLDVGCGDGFVARYLVRNHPLLEVHAVDSALSMPNQGQSDSRSSRVFYYSDAHELQLPAHSVGLVLMLDVLEHCEDDRAVLAATVADPRLQTDAAFLLTAPAFDGLHTSHDRFLGHWRRYTAGQLQTLAQNAGLRVLDSGYFFSSLAVLRLGERLLERSRLRRPREGTGLTRWHGGRFATRVFRHILFADFQLTRTLHALGINLPGLSCYVICRKPGS